MKAINAARRQPRRLAKAGQGKPPGSRSRTRSADVVGIKELKNKLSAYLRLVRAGKTVRITDRGQVVAELRPAATNASSTSRLDAWLEEAAARGVVTLAKENGPFKWERKPFTEPLGIDSQALLDELRADSEWA